HLVAGAGLGLGLGRREVDRGRLGASAGAVLDGELHRVGASQVASREDEEDEDRQEQRRLCERLPMLVPQETHTQTFHHRREFNEQTCAWLPSRPTPLVLLRYGGRVSRDTRPLRIEATERRHTPRRA